MSAYAHKYLYNCELVIHPLNRLCHSILRETMQSVRDLVNFGGFSDCNYLRRTLLKEFQLLESRYRFSSPSLSSILECN